MEVEKQPTSLLGARRDGKDAKAPGKFPLGEVAVDGAGRITPLLLAFGSDPWAKERTVRSECPLQRGFPGGQDAGEGFSREVTQVFFRHDSLPPSH